MIKIFNTDIGITNKQNFNYNINAVSGTIRKSHPKSIITKVKLDDSLLDKIKPMYKTKEWHNPSPSDYRSQGWYTDVENPVVILQVMLCGDNQCLVKFVLDKDFSYNTPELGKET